MKNWYLEIFVRFNESAEISFPRSRDSKCIFEVSRGKTFVEKLMKDVGYISPSFLFLFLITIHRETLILEARTLKQRINSSKVGKLFPRFTIEPLPSIGQLRTARVPFFRRRFVDRKYRLCPNIYRTNQTFIFLYFPLFIKYSSSYSKGTFPINFTKKNNWNIER